MSYNDYVVEYRVATKSGKVKVVRKSFDTELAREKHLNKVDDAGDLIEVLRFSDPQ